MPTLALLNMNADNTPVASLEDDVVISPRGKAITPIVVPEYGEVQIDSNGNAILPFDFLPGVIDQLPANWFYATYPYFKFFDREQRNLSDAVTTTNELTTANPDNVNKWKNLVQRMFVERFKEEGRYHYGLEIGRMALNDGYRYEGEKENGRSADTTELAMKLIFNTVSPDLITKGLIGSLIALVWKWLYVPNLEGNNQWVKDSLAKFFEIQDARVVLSDHTKSGKRVHSVVKMFKKYGTQSAIRTFKSHQLRKWGFTIEVNKYMQKDGTMPPCEEWERWSVHNIEAYLDKRTRNMMRRNGGFDFCVKHSNGDVNHGMMFSGDLQDTVQKALNYGCDKRKIMSNLRDMIEKVERGGIKPFAGSTQNIITYGDDTVEPIATGRKMRKDNSNLVDSTYGADIDNLNCADMNTNDLLDYSLGSLEEDVGKDWAAGAASPVWKSPRRGKEVSPVRPVEEVIVSGNEKIVRNEVSTPKETGTQPRKSRNTTPQYDYTRGGTPPRKSMNKNNSRQEDGSAKNKNEIHEKMKAISVKNKKVRVIVRTMYQIREFC